MKAAILTAIIFGVLTGATDEAYDIFQSLKQKGMEEREHFYCGITNGMAGIDGLWTKNGGGMIFSTSGDNNMLTNVEYYVRVYTASNNLASTNLTHVNQCFRNGEVCRYSYMHQRRVGDLTMIETIGSRRGDFCVYQVDTNGDLDCYFAATNFVGVHGIRQYQNGAVVREGPPPTEFLRLLREAVEN